MTDLWRIPFTALMGGLLIFSILLGLSHSIVAGIFMGVVIWLIQGMLMYLVTGFMFRRLILTNWLCLWSTTILKWTSK
jgi:hypothetical protein